MRRKLIILFIVVGAMEGGDGGLEGATKKKEGWRRGMTRGGEDGRWQKRVKKEGRGKLAEEKERKWGGRRGEPRK